jgi:ribosomal protein S18 acetylase RimI-like enzyme
MKEQPITVRRCEESQIEKAVRVMVDAYRDNPLLRYILPAGTPEHLLRWFVGTGIRHGVLYGDAFTTDGVEGVAVWQSPEHTAFTAFGMFRTGLLFLPFKIGFEAFGRLAGYFGVVGEVRKKMVRGPHWYLSELAVDPHCQGRGLGSALIGPALARADADGLPCYCETYTERGVSFYRKHGFEAAKVVDVPDGGPRCWAMLREPLPLSEP